MKILFIKPNISVRNGFQSISRKSPPIGLAYLATPLLAAGHEVRIIDMVAESEATHPQTATHEYYGLTEQELMQRVREFRPSLIGIGGFTHQHQRIRQIIEAIKKEMPETVILAGGIHATSMPRYFMETTKADYTLQGAGEETALEFVRALENGDYSRIKQIDGIVYRENSGVVIQPRLNFTENLDSIAWPARHLFNHPAYLKDGVSMPVITSRSCVKKCAFCCAFLSSGKKWRYRSPDDVVTEITDLVQKWRYENVCIFDDAANIIPERLVEICKGVALKNLPMRLVFPSSLIAEWLTSDLLFWMKKAGTVFLSLPLEHPNDFMRNEVIGKRLEIRDMFKAFSLCREQKILTMLNLVIGMPGETEDTIADVKRFVQDHAHCFDALSLTAATAFPGTKFYDDCIAKGYLIHPEKNEFLDYDTYTAHVNTPTMSAQRLEEHKQAINKLFLEIRGQNFNEKYLRACMRKPSAKALEYVEKEYFPSLPPVS